MIIIVDGHDRIRNFLPRLEELVMEGLIILNDAEAIRHVGTNPNGTGGGHERIDTPGHER